MRQYVYHALLCISERAKCRARFRLWWMAMVETARWQINRTHFVHIRMWYIFVYLFFLCVFRSLFFWIEDDVWCSLVHIWLCWSLVVVCRRLHDAYYPSLVRVRVHDRVATQRHMLIEHERMWRSANNIFVCSFTPSFWWSANGGLIQCLTRLPCYSVDRRTHGDPDTYTYRWKQEELSKWNHIKCLLRAGYSMRWPFFLISCGIRKKNPSIYYLYSVIRDIHLSSSQPYVLMHKKQYFTISQWAFGLLPTHTLRRRRILFICEQGFHWIETVPHSLTSRSGKLSIFTSEYALKCWFAVAYTSTRDVDYDSRRI